MAIGTEDFRRWALALAQTYAENKDWLTQLDSAIGDADHGINMNRGFQAVRPELDGNNPEDIGVMLKTVAATLIRTVGGAAGPLYGTFFLRAGRATVGKTEIGPVEFVQMFRAGVDGVRQRGKAEPGDKTMVDALEPAVAAMQKVLEDGGELTTVLQEGAAAAERGMLSTIPLEAKKGRASYLGPRSAGHQDPGATSAWLLLKAAAGVWGKVDPAP